MNKYNLIHLLLFIVLMNTCLMAQIVNPDSYPAADNKEWGQLLWNLKLSDQDLSDFRNYQSLDQQGPSACRYTIAFSSYFLAVEQFYKFPAWREIIQPAFDRLVMRMQQKPVWQYWNNESGGITKFEPNMDRPYASSADPVGHANIMYSGHLAMMINLYELLYHDMKWDKPGSIIFQWDSNTVFTYNNKSLQEVMFLQMITNPVPGIECERNAVFPVCNTEPMISWLMYDKMHGTRFFDAARAVFDPWFEKNFINQETHELADFYLIKQGWAFSGWNPRYGNKMDEPIAQMIKEGVDFSSIAYDGWLGAFMHTWNPGLTEHLYPFLKKKHCTINSNSTVTLTKDVITPDAYYGFFSIFASEIGDKSLTEGLLRTADSLFSPLWEGSTYHYPFVDNAPAINLAAADGDANSAAKPVINTPPDTNPKPSGLCCKSTFIKGHGNACFMKTFPQHCDLSDRLLALARALPKDGLKNMINQPFNVQRSIEPAITGVDINTVILKRAIYDHKKKTLIVSTLTNSKGVNSSFKVINLNPAENYVIIIDGKHLNTGHL